jgi:hypothetical protein
VQAITIQEPHISRIMRGEKTLEVRSKSSPWTSAIGETIAIHGSASPEGPHAGHVVGVVTILDVRPFQTADEGAACCALKPDHFVLVLSDVKRLKQPIRASGEPGLWTLPIHATEACLDVFGISTATEDQAAWRARVA